MDPQDLQHEDHEENCFLAMGGGGMCNCSSRLDSSTQPASTGALVVWGGLTYIRRIKAKAPARKASRKGAK